ncbi:MAG: N-acetyl-anhydromuranmyl-L-alanine amidase [Gallionellales bacterium GWA2_55_18]|nr:MAG: N-acetyl-anhydromuranmyl-L-alanine amidase [Gallionellales bacterium GWA2_55_18]
MRIDTQGLLVGGEYIPSPNYDDRPAGEIELLVIHNISLPPGEFGGNDVQRLFTNTLDENAHPYYRAIAQLKLSAHFFVCRNGRIIQFVPCSKRAWHAGESCWQGRVRCNDFSLGIELEGSDTVPFTDAQYTALQDLTMALRKAYTIRGIAGHSDIAPQRKTDPGPHFDWVRYLTKLCGA